IVPQQALALENSSLSFTISRILAKELGEAPDFVAAAFERILGRPPSAREAAESVQYLGQLVDLYRNRGPLETFTAGEEPAVPASGSPEQRARESLVHALFNHNDFVTIR